MIIKKNNKGVTLVMLVITVSILGILAAVSITAAIDGDLIGNANDAKNNWDKKNFQEQIGLAKVKGEMLLDTLPEIEAGEYTGERKYKYIDENGDIAIIPAGFTVSNVSTEGTIREGLVIYSGDHSDVPDMTTVQGTANQYVWIPVENPSDIYGTLDSQVEGIEGYTFGKLYTNASTKSNWPVGGDIAYSNTSRREPAYLTDSSFGDESTTYNKDINGNKLITREGIQTEFNNMITSVEKYKGFYIGRYELTGTIAAPTIHKGENPLVDKTWFNFYKSCIKLEEGNEKANDKVITTIIWGCQWDQAVKKCLSEDKFYLTTNSNLYGVYSDSDITTKGISGRMKGIYNIYDMGGNVLEFTSEAIYNDRRVCRGGYHGQNSQSAPASHVNSDEPGQHQNIIGCRAQLYIK